MNPQNNTFQEEPLIESNPTPNINPIPPTKSKKTIVGLIILFLLVIFLLLAWNTFVKKESKTIITPDSSQEITVINTDKEGIQASVDLYCQELGRAYGFVGMDSGYIISDRFTEEELSDSPNLLRFRQVGNSASATVDCEDDEGPSGISNDLLFIKKEGEWKYIDEVQNNTGSGFLCSKVDQYNVSKELVKKCAPSEGATAIDR